MSGLRGGRTSGRLDGWRPWRDGRVVDHLRLATDSNETESPALTPCQRLPPETDFHGCTRPMNGKR